MVSWQASDKPMSTHDMITMIALDVVILLGIFTFDKWLHGYMRLGTRKSTFPSQWHALQHVRYLHPTVSSPRTYTSSAETLSR